MDRRDYARDTFGEWVNAWVEEHPDTRVPTSRIVCPTCDGRGRYVNPAIDSHGIGADEWAEWDDDEREGYCTGRYDVICGECHGQNVVDRLADYATDEMRQAWEDWERSERQYAAEVAAERRVGA